jgi:hypothetical protein
MKNKEIETLLRTSAMARTEKNTPAGQLYADLCGDLDGWCRQRRQTRRHRRTLLSVGLMALAVLLPLWTIPAFPYRHIIATVDANQACDATRSFVEPQTPMA